MLKPTLETVRQLAETVVTRLNGGITRNAILTTTVPSYSHRALLHLFNPHQYTIATHTKAVEISRVETAAKWHTDAATPISSRPDLLSAITATKQIVSDNITTDHSQRVRTGKKSPQPAPSDPARPYVKSLEAATQILDKIPDIASMGFDPCEDGYASHHDHFLDQFTQKQLQSRLDKKPKALSAKQRAAQRERLKEIRFLKPDYADATKANMAGILRKWIK